MPKKRKKQHVAECVNNPLHFYILKYKQLVIMNIVIVAGGLGTRFKELSVFPKILLPTQNNDSLLFEQLSYMNTAESISIIINTKFYSMLKNYVKVNNININVIESKVSNGSYNSINEVKDKLPQENVFFMWSDILFKQNINIVSYIEANTSLTKPVIFTTSNNSIYRYNFDGNKVESRNVIQNGNVPGSYFIPNVTEFFKSGYRNGMNYDIIDELRFNWSDIEKCEFPELIEYKDIDTYKDIIRHLKPIYNKTRFFNSITKTDHNTMVKKLEDPSYKNVITNEITWYSELSKNLKGYNPSPTFYGANDDNTSFEMEYLDGYISLYQFLNENTPDSNTIKYIYNNIYEGMEILHNSNKVEVPFTTFMNDLYREVVDKIIERCDKIPNMILNYNKSKMIKLLVNAYSILLDTTPTTENGNVMYYFCHGDVHNSNIMINPNTLDIKFIDPRNYFGRTSNLGNLDYEFAKLLYSILGFDHINNNKLVYLADEVEVEKHISDVSFLNNINYKIWSAITFIGLAGYTCGDIMRCNIAYDYGMKLIEQYINEYYESK